MSGLLSRHMLASTQYKLLILLQVSSCFSQLLNLHNLSEEISSAQLERAVRIGEVEVPDNTSACKVSQTDHHDLKDIQSSYGDWR